MCQDDNKVLGVVLRMYEHFTKGEAKMQKSALFRTTLLAAGVVASLALPDRSGDGLQGWRSPVARRARRRVSQSRKAQSRTPPKPGYPRYPGFYQLTVGRLARVRRKVCKGWTPVFATAR